MGFEFFFSPKSSKEGDVRPTSLPPKSGGIHDSRLGGPALHQDARTRQTTMMGQHTHIHAQDTAQDTHTHTRIKRKRGFQILPGQFSKLLLPQTFSQSRRDGNTQTSTQIYHRCITTHKRRRRRRRRRVKQAHHVKTFSSTLGGKKARRGPGDGLLPYMTRRLSDGQSRGRPGVHCREWEYRDLRKGWMTRSDPTRISNALLID